MLDIKVPDQYPLVPPVVYYRTKIFHPNVHFKVPQTSNQSSMRLSFQRRLQ